MAKTFQVAVHTLGDSPLYVLVSAKTKAQAARAAVVHVENTTGATVTGCEAEMVKR